MVPYPTYSIIKMMKQYKGLFGPRDLVQYVSHLLSKTVCGLHPFRFANDNFFKIQTPLWFT